MTAGYDYKQFAILYVDDEEQSLKYFRKAFDKDFTILTASSAERAWDIIDERGQEIGLLITDQRMPGGSGTSLLEKVRVLEPGIVRLLTTAYSDLDSAIQAVNTGAVFKYVVKPWDLQDLRGVLLRAMEFFLVQRERDILLRVKLNVLQRLILTDRVRSLAVLATGISHHIRNSMVALKTFLDAAPQLLGKELPEEQQIKSPEFWEDLWSLAQRESQHILRMVQRVADSTVETRYSFDAVHSLEQLVNEGVARAERETGMQTGVVTADIAGDLPEFQVCDEMLPRFFSIVIKRLMRLTSEPGAISIVAREQVPVWGTRGARILVAATGKDWTEKEINLSFTAFSVTAEDPSDLGLDLLSAFFIIHHHGGELTLHERAPRGPAFEVLLPFEPTATKRPPLEEGCLDRIFRHSGAWETLR